MLQQETILFELLERYPQLGICREQIRVAYEIMKESFASGGKLLVAGNGGSAADSEHIVGELMKGFVKQRPLTDMEKKNILSVDEKMGADLCKDLQQALPAIALTGHPALSTAYLNDVDGTLGFAQQVNGYGTDRDVFWGITTSGNSQNILSAAIVAKAKNMKVIALTVRDGGKIKAISDVAIIVPEKETFKIQELHLPVYHALCLMLEDFFFET